jgi:hypothetical protein
VRARTKSPVDIPVGAYAGGKAAYVFDPDGVEIELIERRRDDASASRASEGKG